MLATATATAASLAGGTTTIANSVNHKKTSNKAIAEQKRHNLTIEKK